MQTRPKMFLKDYTFVSLIGISHMCASCECVHWMYNIIENRTSFVSQILPIVKDDNTYEQLSV